MSHVGGFTRVRAITSLAFLLLLCAAALSSRLNARGADPASSEQAAQPDEIRAMWVLRTSLTTPDRISALVQAARDHGFNTLFVQVRGRGDAYFLGGSEPRPPELLRQPEGFDPLASVLRLAHASGLRVHAWVNVNLVSSAVDLPAAREHVIYRHPAWLMIPVRSRRTSPRWNPKAPRTLASSPGGRAPT